MPTGYATCLVEVGGDGDAEDSGFTVEAARGGLGELPGCVLKGEKIDQLGNGAGLHRNLLVGEERGLDALWVVYPQACFIESGQARVRRQGKTPVFGRGGDTSTAIQVRALSVTESAPTSAETVWFES